jgi:subtilisin family serine protease
MRMLILAAALMLFLTATHQASTAAEINQTTPKATILDTMWYSNNTVNSAALPQANTSGGSTLLVEHSPRDDFGVRDSYLESALAEGRLNRELYGNLSLRGSGGAVRVFVKLRGDQAFRALSDSVRGGGAGQLGVEDLFSQVRARAKSNQESVISKLSGAETVVRHRFDYINGFSADVTGEGLMELLDDPLVERVELVGRVQLHLAESVPLVNGTGVWAVQVGGVNLTGAGQSVCVIDTGVDYTHPNLGGCTQEDFLAGNCGKVPYGYDFYDDDADPMDGDGHGTHVAGIVASDHGTYRGVAPEAKIIAMKVFSDAGAGGTWDDVAAAIENCTNAKDLYNISVITMSIGDGGAYSDPPAECDSGWFGVATALANAYAAGIFIDASSGNQAYTNGISFPACHSNVVSVGSVYDYDGGGVCWGNPQVCCDSSAQHDIDLVVCHSNRHSILDVWAPGYAIEAPLVGGGFVAMGGTSMAAPHVAGAAAILQQTALLRNGSLLTPAQVGVALVHTGRNITRDVVKPRIDVHRAVNSLDFPSNSPPSLSSGDVSPLAGGEGTLFNFTVVYSDSDGDAPSYVLAHMGSVSHAMSSNGSADYAGGVLYHYSTNLTAGSHSFYFNASDGESVNVTGPYSGPDVNARPILSSPNVSPSSGNTSEWYNFSVTYSDADGEAPAAISLILASQSHALSQVGLDYAAGVQYYYNSTLPEGVHSFFFNASDGNHSVQTASESVNVHSNLVSCDGVNPMGGEVWTVDSYTNCTDSVFSPTSTGSGYLNITGGGVLNLTNTHVRLNNTLMILDGVLNLDDSVFEFIR